MLQTAIVGAGLAGLALANLLQTRGADYCVFEARHRLGGRILSVEEPSGLALDFGPTWFWPAENPQLTRLLRALGIETFEQFDAGNLVIAAERRLPPARVRAQGFHAGAHRIVGGVAALVSALASRLGEERIRLGHELLSLEQHDDFIELSFRSQGTAHGRSTVVTQRARSVVLAVPPRLVHQRVRFGPELGPELRAALRETATWMAAHAKAMVTYSSPFWRRAGDSGSARVIHEDAVLGEIFDACDSSERAALGSFVGLGPEARGELGTELASLVTRELAELFGSAALGGTVRVQDWACEPFTTTPLDLEQPAVAPVPANPTLGVPHWNGRLLFCASETAAHHPGHLEGALEAALRAAGLVQERVFGRQLTSAVLLENSSDC